MNLKTLVSVVLYAKKKCIHISISLLLQEEDKHASHTIAHHVYHIQYYNNKCNMTLHVDDFDS